MNLITICLLLISVLIGGIIVEVFKPEKGNNLQILLTSSGSYLFAVCFLHLLPEIFHGDFNNYIGLYILGGFLIQIILEYFSKGIEHGHLHKSKIIPFSVLVSLCAHAFIEGIPLGSHLNHNHAKDALLAGILMHKVPVAIVLMTFFLQSEMKKIIAYLYLLLFALMSPLGVLAGDLFSTFTDIHNEITAIVIGIFIHISTTIIFESSDTHKFSFEKILAIIFGSSIAIFSI